MPPPPLRDTLEALQQCVLPGAGGAALVACIFLLLGRRAAATGSAAAAAAAFLWGNFTLASVGAARPTWENTWRVLPWKPEADAPGYQWLPRAALLLVAVGLASRWVGLVAARFLHERYWWGPGVMVWLPRIAAAVVASGWLVLGNAAQAPEWAGLRWELAAATVLVWFAADELVRKGLGAEASAYLGAALFAGGLVLLYSHNLRFMELAVLMGSAMFGVAAAAGVVKSPPAGAEEPAAEYNPDPELYDARKPDAPPRPEPPLAASGAIPAGALFLVGLLLGTRPSHAENKVPAVCFWLVALAPALLAPSLIPRVARQNKWLLLAGRVVLALAPLVAAVVLAGKHERLAYE
jgi:hypothetical protein